MSEILSGCTVRAAIQQEPPAKTPVDDHHAHVCEACGEIFWHHRDCNLSKEARAEQHKCPSCGAGPYQFGYNTQQDALAVRHLVHDHL